MKEKSNSIDAVRHIVCLAAIIAAVVFAVLYFTTDKRDGSGLSAREQIDDLIILDEGEEAIVQVLNDAATAKDGNVFYKNAEDGDVVYVFQNRVMIYRPSEHRLVNTAPYLGGENFDPSAEANIESLQVVDPSGSEESN